MNNKLSIAIAFLSGAAIASAVTWKFVKTKYERIAQEEIDSVKEVFGRKKINKEEPISEKSDEVEPIDISDYHEVIKETGYNTVPDTNNEEKGEPIAMDRPYIISPDEFGEREGYETLSFTYYTDGVLTDEVDEPVEDIDKLVGKDSLTHFGEYEDDSVFVRNDDLEIDFEILLDLRRYSDVKKRSRQTASE